MKKATIERFIAKYSLGGTSGAVKWVAKDGTVSVHCISDSRNAMADVTAPIVLEDGEYALFDTNQLKSLLAFMDDDIDIIIKKHMGAPIAFDIRAKGTKVTFALGEPKILPEVPTLAMIPTPDLTIPLDDHLVSTFVRAKAALSEVDTFAVVADGTTTQIVLGYNATANTNSVTLAVEPVEGHLKLPVTQYDAKLMREILLANREADAGVFTVSREGFIHLQFTIPQFETNYYLPGVEEK